MSRFHLPLFHCLNGLVISALDLFQDPLGPHADKHRRLAARVSMRLEAREHKSDLVAEVLGIVEALQRHSLTSDLGGERASSSSCSSRSPLLSSAALTLSPPTCAQTSPPSTTARSRPAPSSAARSRSRSRPIRSSPLRAPSASADAQSELAGLWDALAGEYGAVYAAPDRREWDEALRAQQGGGKPWDAGVDLLA